MVNVFQINQWPPTTAMWSWAFVALAVLLVMLAPWRGGRLLLGATAVAVAGVCGGILVLSESGFALPMICWYVLAGVVMGAKLADWIGLPEPAETEWAEWIGVRMLFGMAAISSIAGMLVILRCLNSTVVAVLVALSSLGMIRYYTSRWPVILSAAARLRTAWTTADMRWIALGWSLLAWVFILSLLWAIVPSVHWDAITAHLPMATAFASRTGFAQVADYWFAYVPGQAHLFFALGLVSGGQPMPALFHYSFGVLSAVLVYALTLRLTASKPAAWIGCLAFVSMPLVAWELGTAYLDMFLTAYCLGSVYCVTRWMDEGTQPWLTAAGIFGGYAIATKIGSLPLIVPLMIAVVIFAKSSAARTRLAPYLWPHLLIPLPWFLHNVLVKRNPIYPAMGGFFGNKELEKYTTNWEKFGLGKDLIHYLRLPYDLIMKGQAYGELGSLPFGLVPVAVLVSILFWRKLPGARRAWLLAGLALIATTLWFMTGQVARYLLPAMSLMSVLAATTFVSVARWNTAMKVALAALALCVFTYSRCLVTLMNYNLSDGYPFRYALGFETADAFLLRGLKQYPSLQFVERNTSPGAKVLGASGTPRAYNKVVVDDPNYKLPLLNLTIQPVGEELARQIRWLGYEYIMVDEPGIRGTVPAAYASLEFLRRFTKPVFSFWEVKVYKLNDVAPATPGRELLTNGSLDELLPNHMPSAWDVYGKPEMKESPASAHSGPAFVVVTQDDLLAQKIAAKPLVTYTNRIWARADAAGQVVWLQVLWFDKEMKILDTDIRKEQVDGQWRRYEVSFGTDKPNAAYAQFYARAAAGSRVMVDDVSVVEGW